MAMALPTEPVRPVISADSHLTEPPGTYGDFIEARWKEKAPRLQRLRDKGDFFVIDGMKSPVPLGLVAAASPPRRSTPPSRATGWRSRSPTS